MEYYGGMAIIGAGLVYWGYRKYKIIMADGKVTLDEVLDVVNEGSDLISGAVSLSKMKRMKKADLIAFCNKNGLDEDGTKADLLSRLEESYKSLKW